MEAEVIQRPRDIELESVLLGTIMRWSAITTARKHITEDVFYDNTHKEIFRFLVKVNEDGGSINPVLLPRLIKKYNSPAIDMLYILECIEKGIMEFEIKQMCQYLYELYIKGQLINAGLELYNQSFTTDPFNLRDKVINDLGKLGLEGHTSSSLEDVSIDVEKYFNDLRAGNIRGIQTGITEFDAHTGGLQDSDLIVLGSYSSNGKTATALNISNNAGAMGIPGKYYSYEMSKNQLLIRLMGLISGFSSTDIVLKKMFDHPRVKMALETIKKYPLYLDTTHSHINNLLPDIKHSKSKYGLQYVIVDHLQLMSSNHKEPHQVFGYIANKLKALANELNIPIVLISQLKRPGDGPKKAPTMSMLKESGDIENAADIVWLPWIPFKEPTEAKIVTLAGVDYASVYGEQWVMHHNISKGRNYGTTKWLSMISPSLKIESFKEGGTKTNYIQQFEQDKDAPF